MKAEGTAGSHVDARPRTPEGVPYDPLPPRRWPARNRDDLVFWRVLRGDEPEECECGRLPRHEAFTVRGCTGRTS